MVNQRQQALFITGSHQSHYFAQNTPEFAQKLRPNIVQKICHYFAQNTQEISQKICPNILQKICHILHIFLPTVFPIFCIFFVIMFTINHKYVHVKLYLHIPISYFFQHLYLNKDIEG